MGTEYTVEIVSRAEWRVIAPSGRRVATVRPEIAQVVVSVLNAERLHAERPHRCVCGSLYEHHVAGRACANYRRAEEPILRMAQR
jgi:archaeosine-15-forming tRNA-guanine transglycosylase